MKRILKHFSLDSTYVSAIFGQLLPSQRHCLGLDFSFSSSRSEDAHFIFLQCYTSPLRSLSSLTLIKKKKEKDNYLEITHMRCALS